MFDQRHPVRTHQTKQRSRARDFQVLDDRTRPYNIPAAMSRPSYPWNFSSRYEGVNKVTSQQWKIEQFSGDMSFYGKCNQGLFVPDKSC